MVCRMRWGISVREIIPSILVGIVVAKGTSASWGLRVFRGIVRARGLRRFRRVLFEELVAGGGVGAAVLAGLERASDDEEVPP